MKKPEIARRLALQAGLSPAEAADHLDRVVYRILSNLRRGKETPLPGLGRFSVSPQGKVIFRPEKGEGGGNR
jgi:nucleoid DNA-binding protein